MPPGWEAHPLTLEELTLAYLREPGAAALPGPARGRTPNVGADEMTALTTLTVPARRRRSQAAAVPWRRMAWVIWRQHRLALAVWSRCSARLAVYLLVTGIQIHHAYAAVAACHPASWVPAGSDRRLLSTTGRGGGIAALLQAVPALIGAFAGAPVLAREFETGTFRYAWTLGFGRWRWALAKLVPLAVAVAAAAGAFSLLFSWYYGPFFAEGQQTSFAPTVFDLRGVAFAAWTLAAFAIGALAGVLIRRVVPAIAAALAVYAGLALAAGGTCASTTWPRC